MSPRIAYSTHKGTCRRQQDALAIDKTVVQRRSSGCVLLPTRHFRGETLIAIADGVAASPTAARASSLALHGLIRAMEEPGGHSFDGLVGVRHVRAAQRAICGAMAAGFLGFGASTTLVAAHIRGNQLGVVNCGDSRAYLLREGAAVERLSRDHTEQQRLIEEGAAIVGGKYASIYDGLSDCLMAGAGDDDFAVHRSVTTLAPGDRVILCSDGVHGVVDEVAWLAEMVQLGSPKHMIAATCKAVLKRGAPDNLSMIAAAV